MPTYVYRAKNHAQQLIEGRLEADNERAALLQLSREGVAPLSLEEALAAAARPPDLRSGPSQSLRVPARTLAVFTRQLSDLLGAGLTLLTALQLLIKQTEHPLLRQVTEDLVARIREGGRFSEALRKHPAVFGALYVNLVAAGEVGGALEKVLIRLADLLEAEDELKAKIRQALVYPAFILGIGALTVGVLLVMVIPKLAALFEDMGQQLPLPTRALIELSGWVRIYWWLLAGLAAGGAAALRQYRRQPAGRMRWDRLQLGVPVLGALIQRVEVARFTRTLSVLLSQGVPILEALSVVTQSAGNAVLADTLQRVRQDVRDGRALSASLSRSTVVPAFVQNMVAVGEESGTLEVALLKVAAAYERDADRVMKIFTTLLEPVLLVLVGGVVAFVVMAMLLPIFQIGLMVQ